MNEIKERIFDLVKEFGNAGRFCTAIGYNYQSFKSFEVRENGLPGVELIAKILEYYPDLNPYWLLLGEGERFKLKEPESNFLQFKISTLEEKVKLLEENNATLKKLVKMASSGGAAI